MRSRTPEQVPQLLADENIDETRPAARHDDGVSDAGVWRSGRTAGRRAGLRDRSMPSARRSVAGSRRSRSVSTTRTHRLRPSSSRREAADRWRAGRRRSADGHRRAGSRRRSACRGIRRRPRQSPGTNSGRASGCVMPALPVPWFVPMPDRPSTRPRSRAVPFPCVLKPVALSGSRGVMRADDPAQLAAAFARLRALLRSPDIRAERDDAHEDGAHRGIHPGPRIRGRRPAASRRASPAGDLRQAGSARRPVLRGDDLPDAVVVGRRRAGGDRRRRRSRGGGDWPVRTGPSTPSAG